MVHSMEFVGTTVDELLTHTRVLTPGGCVVGAAHRLLEAMEPIGQPFDMPWLFTESFDVFADQLPAHLRCALEEPGSTPTENHLEACAVSLALEAGVTLQPLRPTDMRRLQHTAAHALQSAEWGRRSPHPWDSVAAADLHRFEFFALRANI